jgi:hypothetical protein
MKTSTLYPETFAVNYSQMDTEMKEYFDLMNFLGYQLARCNNGRAWDTPFKRVIDNPFSFNFHGLLFVENRNYDYRKLKTWDNIMSISLFIINKFPKKSLEFHFTLDSKILWNKIIEIVREN